MRNKKYSKEMREQALHAFESGLSYRFVAQALEIPLYTARDWQSSYLRGELRWTWENQNRKVSGFSDEEKRAFLDKVSSGEMSIKAVSRKAGVAPSTVRYWRRSLTESKDGNKIIPKSKLIPQEYLQKKRIALSRKEEAPVGHEGDLFNEDGN